MALKGSTTVGIDIGTADSIIAYVCKNGVDVVQNEVSSRKTPTVVGFNDRERLLGDAAAVVQKSNFKNTVRNFRHIMGPMTMCAEQISREEFWQLAESLEGPAEDGAISYRVNYRGEEKIFSATQIMGMYLTKMKETAEQWCNSKVIDVVISVPSYFNDFQRQGMLDAAQVAGLNCLRLMNEHTATALAYGIYRVKDFDNEKPTVTAFAHMGHSNFSISICSFNSRGLQVLAEVSDVQCAGREMDKVLVEHFAEQFNKKFGCNPIKSKKAKLKLEDAVQKCKKILSANDEASVSVECLMEDEDLSGRITRDDFESLCAPLQKRVEDAIAKCLSESGLSSIDEISFVEIVGGASRVPWFQRIIKEKLGKELSRTLNADECIARGCALMAAILSPAYKVRDFGVEDKVPHGVTITWMGSKADPVDADKDGDEAMPDAAEAAPESGFTEKSMEVFDATKDKMNARKYITWYRHNPFDLGAKYTADGTSIGQYRIEMGEHAEKKKVKIEAKMSIHGIFSVDSATIVETEEYEEVVKEKREIVEEAGDVAMEGGAEKQGEAGNGENKEQTNGTPSETSSAAAEGASQDGEKKEETKKEEPKKPKYEWVEVKKPKKRTKRTPLVVTPSGNPGTGEKLMAAFKDVESKLLSDTKDVKENDNRRNDLESYIYAMKQNVANEKGDWAAYIQTAAREQYGTDLQTAEDWLYDHFDATTVELCDKLAELQGVGKPVQKRFQDRQDLKNYLPTFQQAVSQIRTQANNPSDDFAHIAAEKKQNVVAAADQLESWASSQEQAVNSKPLFEDLDAAFSVAILQTKLAEVAKLCKQVMSEPKPAPPPAPVETEGEHQAAKDEPMGDDAAGSKPEGDEGMTESAQEEQGDGAADKTQTSGEETKAGTSADGEATEAMQVDE
ncbi:unnamed protein product [Amoebophrya sp. A25]|nr:unnamed protein product [Amoebophrya sp. A25]|eukprot:GSA25T00016566001.1